MRHTRLVACVLVAVATTVSGAPATSDARLVEAAAAQQPDLVRQLLAKGVDANSTRADGATALLFAAHWDDLASVDLLLKAGAKVNVADDHGVTPLALACENASAAMTGRLLAAGANPNVAQSNGLTPLMIAARTGSVAVVNALVKAGAHVNAATMATHETEI